MGKRRDSIVRAAGFGSGLFAGLWFVGSAAFAAPTIYTCIDANGKRLTSDRPIAECLAREQRLLNPDGSLRRIVPPTPTPEERAEQEARERQAAALRVQQQDAIRRDRNLILRFPNEATHNNARAAALDDIHAAVQLSEKRIAVLAAERKPLLDESEFYPDGKLPLKLRQQLDANDAASAAQRSLIQNQQAEIVRINMRYDAELARLRRLWSGAPAGSMGTLSAAPAASAARR
ncbi:DUF4124 domain-containing protein [Piscinibacter sp.]|uniref:DUF4124 domain-containing protein n=1 Tax=Piscinibacter sp. TaxID=1903157 RepID=UPI002BC34944|nr:DUF4124 domain-containing protein [Albitalea sp.]HUG22977.1 DUF4124 domain-containing protein [Albitalea sp.]